GIGTTHPASLAIMGVDWGWWVPDNLLTENEPARVAVELGFIGFFLTYLARVIIIIFALRSATTFKDPAYGAIGSVLAVYLALSILASVMLSPTSELYYWGALGLMLAMRRLERSAKTEMGVLTKPRKQKSPSQQLVSPRF